MTRWICRVCLRVLRKLHLLRRCGLPATLLLTRFFLLLFSVADFLGLLLFELLFGGVESVPGFPQSIQSVLSLPEFLRELVSAFFWPVFVVFGFVDLGSLLKDIVDFVGNLLTSAVLVESRVALDATAVQGDFAHLSHPSFSAEAKNLDEEVLELLAVVLAEEADRAEVRVLIRGEVAKGDVTFEEAVEFPGAPDADAVAEDEDFEHHHGMGGRPRAAVLPIIRIEWVEPALVVEMIDNVRNVAFEAILFDPLRDVLWQKVLLILIVSDEVERHEWILTLYRSFC
nr:hypothetical protein [Saliphagus infecundisoli]